MEDDVKTISSTSVTEPVKKSRHLEEKAPTSIDKNNRG